MGDPALSANALPRWWPIAIWFVSCCWAVLNLPYAYGFQAYVFFDTGWALTTNALLVEGLLPTRDFTFTYGLLTLLVDRAWFTLFGATPLAQAALCLVCAGISTQAFIRFAEALRPEPVVQWLLLVCAPLAIMPTFYASPTHALDHTLLLGALACQARGQTSTALLLAVVDVFVKAGLSDCYALILAARIVLSNDPYRFVKLMPAALTGLTLAAVLAIWFGIEPLIATLFPLDAVRLYEAEQYGFFTGAGRQFWLPEPMDLLHYLRSPALFWIAGTMVLLVGSFGALRRIRDPICETAVVCCVLHGIFVIFLFGNEESWRYYPHILVLGVCASLPYFSAGIRPFLAAALAVLAVLGQALFALICLAMVLNSTVVESAHSSSTAGLLASPEDQAAWLHVREIGARERVLVLSPVGAGHELMPELASPRSWYLLRSIARPAEVNRLREQIRAADWLVIPLGPLSKLTEWPELQDVLSPFRVVETHASFLLARRIERR